MKLKKPAQIGSTIFGVGIDWRTVIERAQREYVYQKKPEITAARLRKLKRFINRCGAGKPTGLRTHAAKMPEEK